MKAVAERENVPLIDLSAETKTLFETMGVEAMYKCQRGKRPSRLDAISDELEEYFDKNPPSDAPNAVRMIKERFGIVITVTPVKNWLKAKAIHTKKQKVYLQKQT